MRSCAGLRRWGRLHHVLEHPIDTLTLLCRQREKRLEDEKLRKVKTLGEAADDVDDVAAWINKSRALEEKAKADARAKALKAAQALEEQVRIIVPRYHPDKLKRA